MPDIGFDRDAWKDYLWWQQQDRRTLKRINDLLKEIMRDPAGGIGHAEPLRGDLAGLMSRHIDEANRLTYEIRGDQVFVVSCRGHYDDH